MTLEVKQKRERNGKIVKFDNLTLAYSDSDIVIYIVSLTGYDEIIENKENKMIDALKTFEQTLNSSELSDKEIILFWNKTDLLEKNIMKEDTLKNLFTDYKGGKDFEKAMEFIQDIFRGRIEEERRKRVFEIQGNAIETKVIETLFEKIHEKASNKVKKN